MFFCHILLSPSHTIFTLAALFVAAFSSSCCAHFYINTVNHIHSSHACRKPIKLHIHPFPIVPVFLCCLFVLISSFFSLCFSFITLPYTQLLCVSSCSFFVLLGRFCVGTASYQFSLPSNFTCHLLSFILKSNPFSSYPSFRAHTHKHTHTHTNSIIFNFLLYFPVGLLKLSLSNDVCFCVCVVVCLIC